MDDKTTQALTDEECPHLRNREDCEDCWRDADNLAEIKSLVAHADEAISEALRATAQAGSALRDLISDRVYDVELAEGDGTDAWTELERAALSLRHARRIIAPRRRLLEGEG